MAGQAAGAEGFAIAKGLKQVGETFGGIADDFAQVEEKRRSRKAAVDLADKVSTYNEVTTAKLRELNAKADLSKDAVLQEYGAFLDQQRTEMLDAHAKAGGTPDSLARLTIRLDDIESKSTISAAILSSEIGLQKVTDRLDADLSALIADVQADPARLDDALGRWGARMDDFTPGLDEGPERALRQHGRNVLTSTAINRALGAGDVAGAEQQLNAATRSGLLDADTTASLTSKITDARLQQNELLFKINQFEASVGHPATESEILAILNVPQPAGPQLNITIPTGYAPISDSAGNLVGLEPIPGGPVARDIVEKNRTEANRSKTEGRQQDIILQDIGRTLSLIETSKLPTTGFTGSFLSFFGGTEARDLKSTLDTIRANVGFEKLQQMRNASPTGGALGQVSEMENRLLQSVLGSLEQSQSKEQLVFNLRRLENTFLDIVHGPNAGPPRLPLTEKPTSEGLPELQQIKTQDEVDKLPSGTIFIWAPTGKKLRKE